MSKRKCFGGSLHSCPAGVRFRVAPLRLLVVAAVRVCYILPKDSVQSVPPSRSSVPRWP
jgi:hypothetical protein